jgi:hypothetical protein
MYRNDDYSDERPLDEQVIRPLRQSPLPRVTVEDDVVGELHASGILGLGHRRPATRKTGVVRRRLGAWAAYAAAAALLFFAGLRIGDNNNARAVSLASDDTSLATRVRENAARFISVLATVQPNDDSAALVAEAAFHLAASELIRIAPRSDVAHAIRLAFPRALAFHSAPDDPSRITSNVRWY